jgi:indolepyruvate ferredoxin oxidoreductase beta subunit
MSHSEGNSSAGTRGSYDVLIVGVGGQGVLTMGELITQAAVSQGIPANFYPMKGMAQRGGSVSTQVRLGRRGVGPRIPEAGADLVIAMEVSEALLALRFIKAGGEVLLFDNVWLPMTAVLGDSAYPSTDTVLAQVRKSGAKVCRLSHERLPVYSGLPVPANVYVLGAALGSSCLGDVIEASVVTRVMRDRWTKDAQRNIYALKAGLKVRFEE